MRKHVYELQIGDYITCLDCSWEKSPYAQPFYVRDIDINTLQHTCTYVDVDDTMHDTTLEEPVNKELSDLADAILSHAKTANLNKTLLAGVRGGKPLNTEAVDAIVEESVMQVLQCPNSMMLLTQLKNVDEYTAQHSLNVCVLGIRLATYLEYDKEEVKNIGLCGLLHDIGKMRIPLDVLNKPGDLTDVELTVMQTHTTKGYDILIATEDIYPEAIRVTLCHHEQINGKGYPYGIDKEDISTYTRIIAIVDAYDAITSDRVYKKGRLHIQALNILRLCSGTQFDSDLVTAFADSLGFYPVGNAVEMHNKEEGIVIEAGDGYLPSILIMVDKDKQPCPSFVIDLATSPLDKTGQPYEISMVLENSDHVLTLTHALT